MRFLRRLGPPLTQQSIIVCVKGIPATLGIVRILHLRVLVPQRGLIGAKDTLIYPKFYLEPGMEGWISETLRA